MLLQATGYVWGPIDALQVSGPILAAPAISCAENDVIWTSALRGCRLRLRKNRIGESEMAHLQALVRKRLSRPLAEFGRKYTGLFNDYEAADLTHGLD